MMLSLKRATSGLINGLSSIIRGATQAVTAPLRSLITAKKGAPNIIEKIDLM